MSVVSPGVFLPVADLRLCLCVMCVICVGYGDVLFVVVLLCCFVTLWFCRFVVLLLFCLFVCLLVCCF